MQESKIFTYQEILTPRYVSYQSKSERSCLMGTEAEMLSRWDRLTIKAIWAAGSSSIRIQTKSTICNSQTPQLEPVTNRQAFSKRTFHISTSIKVEDTKPNMGWVNWKHIIIWTAIEAKVDLNLCKIQWITKQKEIWARNVCYSLIQVRYILTITFWVHHIKNQLVDKMPVKLWIKMIPICI